MLAWVPYSCLVLGSSKGGRWLNWEAAGRLEQEKETVFHAFFLGIVSVKAEGQKRAAGAVICAKYGQLFGETLLDSLSPSMRISYALGANSFSMYQVCICNAKCILLCLMGRMLERSGATPKLHRIHNKPHPKPKSQHPSLPITTHDNDPLSLCQFRLHGTCLLNYLLLFLFSLLAMELLWWLFSMLMACAIIITRSEWCVGVVWRHRNRHPAGRQERLISISFSVP
mmetsp:Transcript_7837/g.18107  ORF Transcript_7837/g.18107 Transcript_7837/m.18107 type:complete len:227 (+) Transcript_7837:466-1146(+)